MADIGAGDALQPPNDPYIEELATWMLEERGAMMADWKAKVSELILACDQPGLDDLVIALALHRVAGVEDEMRAVLAAAPHDVQVWWSGECNCDGHLN